VTQAVQAEIVTGSLPAGGVSTSAQGTLPITEGEVSWFAQLLAMMQAHAGVDAPVPAEVRVHAPPEGENAPTPAEMAQMANWLSLPVLWTPPSVPAVSSDTGQTAQPAGLRSDSVADKPVRMERVISGEGVSVSASLAAMAASPHELVSETEAFAGGLPLVTRNATGIASSTAEASLPEPAEASPNSALLQDEVAMSAYQKTAEASLAVETPPSQTGWREASPRGSDSAAETSTSSPTAYRVAATSATKGEVDAARAVETPPSQTGWREASPRGSDSAAETSTSSPTAYRAAATSAPKGEVEAFPSLGVRHEQTSQPTTSRFKVKVSGGPGAVQQAEGQVSISPLRQVAANTFPQEGVVATPPENSASEWVRQLTEKMETLSKQQEQGRVTLQLEPEHLGRLRVTVSLREGAIHTHIVADNHTVRQMLENNSSLLQQALQQRGLQLGALQVSVQGDGRQFLLHQPYAPPRRGGWLEADAAIRAAHESSFVHATSGGINLLA